MNKINFSSRSYFNPNENIEGHEVQSTLFNTLKLLSYFTILIPLFFGLALGVSELAKALKGRAQHLNNADTPTAANADEVGKRIIGDSNPSGVQEGDIESPAVVNTTTKSIRQNAEAAIPRQPEIDPFDFTDRLIHAAHTDINAFISMCEEVFENPELLSKSHEYDSDFEKLFQFRFEKGKKYGFLKELALLRMLSNDLWRKIPQPVIEKISYISWRHFLHTDHFSVTTIKIIKRELGEDIAAHFFAIIKEHRKIGTYNPNDYPLNRENKGAKAEPPSLPDSGEPSGENGRSFFVLSAAELGQ